MKDTGLNSGFMLPQYLAAALVSENKIFAHPASVDSIPSSLGQEDHVSMGAISATKLLEVVKNAETVLAIELMSAAQARTLSIRLKPEKASKRCIPSFENTSLSPSRTCCFTMISKLRCNFCDQVE